MPEIAAAQTAADMTYAKPHEFMPTGGSTEWSMEEKGAGNNQERNLYREESNRCMEW